MMVDKSRELRVGTMRLSVGTPVVTMLPVAHAQWEETGTIEDVARIAEAADRLGYHHLTCSEHIGVPATEAPRRGARYWDPLSTFGYLAARTERIRLATNVLVLGYHHPLEIAKRYGTLDVVSGGRVILGVGVGTLKEEFDLIGAPFEDRGARADDALRALRASLSQAEPAYAGEYYDFGGLVVDPCAVQAKVPLWVGGRTLRSLRRAAALADGWCPFAVGPDQAREWLDRVELPDGFDVVLGPGVALDPIDRPDETRESLVALAGRGATIASVHFVHHSVDHYVEQLEALAALHEG
jgi:probable F420-dependent oxidoreductase